MGRYFYLQCKRLVRTLPGALCVILVLLTCLGLVFSATMKQDANQEENQKICIAICGETDDIFFQMGLRTIESLDSSRFAMEIQLLSEPEAHAALGRGDLAAYAVIPDGFMDAAFVGDTLPIRFVSSTGASTMVSVFKDEITRVITDLLFSSQKGVFGMHDAFYAHSKGRISSQMDALSLEYVEYILVRDQIYSLQVLGIADSLPLQEYLLCGLSVLFLWLCCLPFAPKLLRPDPAMGQLLKSRGKSLLFQLFCDFGAYALMLLPIAALPAIGGFLVPNLLQAPLWQVLLTVVAMTLLCASMSFFLYQLSSQLLNGVLLQFFVSIAMCFVSGCMYPVFFFPEPVQRLAAWLPAGLSRSALAGCVTNEFSSTIFLAMAGYSCLFLCLSWLIRKGSGKGANL